MAGTIEIEVGVRKAVTAKLNSYSFKNFSTISLNSAGFSTNGVCPQLSITVR
jgi:hypothetical protein